MLRKGGAELDLLGKPFEDLDEISTHRLGAAANAHVRQQALEAKLQNRIERVTRLEAKLR